MKPFIPTILMALFFLIPKAEANQSTNTSPLTIKPDKISASGHSENIAYSILVEAGKVITSTGIMKQILHLSDGVSTTKLTIDNASLISQDSKEVAFRIFTN